MNPGERKFWRAEMAMLDTLYRHRQETATKLIEAYDLQFRDKIRDLKKTEYVPISEFYPAVREIVATIAMNYPRLFFEVTDDEAQTDGIDVEDLLERASSSLFEITHTKEHVHQGLMDALFCQIGWIGIDYNPPGDDIIAPWVANDADAEDLVSFNRRPPFCVHLDPTCPPHQLGHARYIREKMLIPLKYLRDDKTIKNRKDIKPTSLSKGEEIGFGELLVEQAQSAEGKAMQEALDNGEFVLADRIHCRVHVPGSDPKGDPRRLIMFAPGVEDPIKDVPHPFMRRTYTQRTSPAYVSMENPAGLMFDPETQEPVMDLETRAADGEIGEPGRGWLVQNGFPFVPVKLDLHPTSFYPTAHLKYLEGLQLGIIESMSRKASMLKRFSRVVVANESEKSSDAGSEVAKQFQRAEDGEVIYVRDRSNWGVFDFGGIPVGQNDYEDRLRADASRMSRTRQIADKSGMTATQASLMGAAAEVNEQWGEAAVSAVYVALARNAFTIMGDYRFTPEAFRLNVAPSGEQRFTRALMASDFMWNYRISVQAGSMQPLFQQMQQEKALAFYDRAIQMPDVFELRGLAKWMANIFDVGDPEKLMVQDMNPEAMRSAQLENDMIVNRFQDPGVLPEQDHTAHLQVHPQYRQLPPYQELLMRAQQMSYDGRPADPHAAIALERLDGLMNAHVQAHQQAKEQTGGATPRRMASVGDAPQGIIGQVRSNAQQLPDAAAQEARQQA